MKYGRVVARKKNNNIAREVTNIISLVTVTEQLLAVCDLKKQPVSPEEREDQLSEHLLQLQIQDQESPPCSRSVDYSCRPAFH